MSSLPGYILEDFLMWNYNILIENENDANTSLKYVDALGLIDNRRILTKEQFKKIVDLFEEYRENIEFKLEEYNDSWRMYVYYAFDNSPEELYDKGEEFIRKNI